MGKFDICFLLMISLPELPLISMRRMAVIGMSKIAYTKTRLSGSHSLSWDVYAGCLPLLARSLHDHARPSSTCPCKSRFRSSCFA